MKLRVAACGVFEPYLRRLADEVPHEIHLTVLDAGLHSRPHDLRDQAQTEIDAAAEEGGYDAVLLVYGLCGRGTAGLVTRSLPVIIPRAHDCITLFLGSAEAYRAQFARHPGTYYSTLGWIEKSTHPRHPGAAHLYRNFRAEGYEHHPAFPDLERRLGDDNAKHVLAFLDGWKKNYTRAAYIDLGLPGEEEYARFSRRMAEVNGWQYERLQGDAELLRRALSGDWDDSRLFVLPPGCRSASTGDDRILEAVPLEAAGSNPNTKTRRLEDTKRGRHKEPPRHQDSHELALTLEHENAPRRPRGAFFRADTKRERGGSDGAGVRSGSPNDPDTQRPNDPTTQSPHDPTARVLGLGIDAGGTYTDAVLYDLEAREVVAKAKALTTYHDLVVGIRGALAQLPAAWLPQVQVSSLSTTLATNAIVEGRGHKVGLLVLAPWDWFVEGIGHQPALRLRGTVDSTGEVLEPLDEDYCRACIRRLVDEERCAAVVVAGYGLVRNPEQAYRVRELVREHADVPVVCAHEVSRRLNAVRGAQTAVANAKLLPVIRHLIDSVHAALAELGVPGKLMVVKGDGTPVDERVARERPVETILSGPAASVSGARVLTGLDDALVMDVGGTTTDCAILERGHVAVSPQGARVGSWVMSVDVVEVTTVGLGGDSRLDFTREHDLTLGPQRNVPFCYLAREHPTVRRFLESFDKRYLEHAVDASALDVLVLGSPTRLSLTEAERRILTRLGEGPLPVLHLAREMGAPSHKLLPLERLEAGGAVKRCALTPTDLLHVTGQFVRWDADASRRALRIFAAMLKRPPDEVLEEALALVTRRIFEEALRREVSHEDPSLHALPEEWRYLLDKAFRDDGRGLAVRLALRRPVVALGAPAAVLVPPLRGHLDAEVLVPEHADVANAVGAIATETTVREEVVIQPGVVSSYVLYATGARLEFAELRRATERAEEIARSEALRRAREAGAADPRVTVTHCDRNGTLAGGDRLFLERRIVAVASGPAFAAAGAS